MRSRTSSLFRARCRSTATLPPPVRESNQKCTSALTLTLALILALTLALILALALMLSLTQALMLSLTQALIMALILAMALILTLTLALILTLILTLTLLESNPSHMPLPPAPDLDP